MSSPLEFETRPIPRLLWMYAMPAIVGQLVASLYNIADRVILGQYVGPLAIAGLAITLPIMNVIHAFGSLVGAGSAARMSIVLGRKDLRWAEKILGNSVLLTFFFGFLFVSGGYLFMRPLLSAFGASADTLSYAQEYVAIVLPGMFLTTLTFNLTGLMRSSGYPNKSMWILAGGALFNILLDLLFITVFHWGISGAAWATTTAMAVSSAFAVWHFVPKKTKVASPEGDANATVVFRSHAWAPKGYIFRNILAIGISPFLMNLAASGVAVIMNYQLIRYGGDLAVGAYGIINSSTLIIFLLLMGICQGMQPIAGYNYGAGHSHRLRQTYRLTLAVCLSAGVLGLVACCGFPRLILRCFTTDTTLIELGIPAMRYITVLFPLISFTITNSQFFQSIDKPWIAIVTSLSRQVLFLVPMLFLVPWLLIRSGGDGLTGVWLSCTLSDILGALLSAVLLYGQRAVFHDGYKPPLRKPLKERGPKKIEKTLLLLIAAIILSLGSVQAQNNDTSRISVTSSTSPVGYNSPTDTYPRIGLALGGGGAKGAAHIGVLRYLEEQGIRPYCIAGTSMGAIVGGFYALGYSADQLDTIISGINWSNYFGGTVARSMRSAADRSRNDRLIISVPLSLRSSDSLRYAQVSSFVGGSSLTNLFNNLSVGYQDSISFDSLPIPFACVATDLCTGSEVVLRSGRLPQAIRSSMAIPTVFDPVSMGSMVLADGGMVNNFPIDICREMGADIVIGVEVGDELQVEAGQLSSLPRLLSQLMGIIVSGKTAANRQYCDIYVRPDIRGYHVLSFSSAAIDTLIRRGYDAARSTFETQDLPSLAPAASDVTHSDSNHKSAIAVLPATNLYADSLLLSGVTFVGVPVGEQVWLSRRAGLEPGRLLSAADLDRAADFITATGAYRDVTYRVRRTGQRGDTLAVLDMVNRHDSYHLTVELRPTPPHTVGLGFRYDSEESASLLLDVGLNRNRFSGAKLDLSARLSYNPRLQATLTFSGFALGNVSLDYRYGHTDYTLVEGSGIEQHINYADHRIRGYLSEFSFRRLTVSGGLNYHFVHYQSLLGDTVSLPGRSGNVASSFFLHARFEDLDEPLLSRHGSLCDIDLNFGADTSIGHMPTLAHSRWGIFSLRAATHLTPGNSVITVVPSMNLRWLLSRGDAYRFHRNLVGGVMPGRYVDQQMPFLGVLAPHVVGDAILTLRCDLRLHLGTHHILAFIGNYLYQGADLNQFFQFNASDLRGEFGCAVRYAYATRVGPFSIDLATSTLNPNPQLYFSFGYNF